MGAITIAVINQKGGVGKSTTVYALGAGLALKGYKVLYVDLDAQSNLTYTFGVYNMPFTTLEVISETVTAKEAILQTERGDIIPAKSGLAVVESLLGEDFGKNFRLKEALEEVKEDYNFILIDTPPSLNVLTANALTACNRVIIPAQTDAYSLQGIGQLSQTIATIQKYCNKDLTIDGILLTRFKPRTILSRDLRKLMEQTAEQLGTKVYETAIRESTAIQEAQALRKNIFEHAPASNASKDYEAFIEEFLNDIYGETLYIKPEE